MDLPNFVMDRPIWPLNRSFWTLFGTSREQRARNGSQMLSGPLGPRSRVVLRNIKYETTESPISCSALTHRIRWCCAQYRKSPISCISTHEGSLLSRIPSERVSKVISNPLRSCDQEDTKIMGSIWDRDPRIPDREGRSEIGTPESQIERVDWRSRPSESGNSV